MAKKIGRLGTVKVGSNTIASLEGWSYDESMSPVDNTDLDQQEMDYESGDITRTGSITTKMDKADSAGQGALAIGAEVTLVLQPEGDTTGDVTETITALITSVGIAVERGSMVKQTFGWQGKGAKTVGAVA